jgi:hypothetical protein
MTNFNIAEISVTHTYYYQPDDYLEYCQENDIEPTEEGFYNFILPEINEDFPSSGCHLYEVIHTKA